MSRKELLALVLTKEKETLPPVNMFGESNHIEYYDAAINYLRTGKKGRGYKKNELLLGVIEDFDIMCADYGI